MPPINLYREKRRAEYINESEFYTRQLVANELKAASSQYTQIMR